MTDTFVTLFLYKISEFILNHIDLCYTPWKRYEYSVKSARSLYFTTNIMVDRRKKMYDLWTYVWSFRKFSSEMTTHFVRAEVQITSGKLLSKLLQ